MTEAACIVVLASLVAAAAAGFAAYAVLQGAALLICAAGAGFLLLHLRKGQTLQLAERHTDARVLERITAICRDISRGNFEARLTHIEETGVLAEANSRSTT